ncbi:hypothetical protein ACFYOT_37960 [Saccharothrix saharensis]|uniref:hypothetical protein n=1 Tax=Saccharothrix saharensis TaxID=571190 RepID=UPI0036AC1DA6
MTLKRVYVSFGMELATRYVHILDTTADPDGPWPCNKPATCSWISATGQTTSDSSSEVDLYRNGSLVASADNHKFSSRFADALPSKSPHVSGTYESGALGAVLWLDNTITEIPQIYSGAISF